MTLNEVWNFTYDEYIDYLLNKYGPAQFDYFCTPECKSKNPRISRTKEGLECHHIDEKKALLLSYPNVAKLYPYEYQKANRLCYADRIEHLLLHHKIVLAGEGGGTYGCGSKFIIGSINSMFQVVPTNWELNMYNKVKDYFEVYIEILRRIAWDYTLHNCPLKIINRTLFAHNNPSIVPTVVKEAFDNHSSKKNYEFE